MLRMRNSWRAIALVAIGFSGGMAFVVACGSDDQRSGGIPGVPPAWAQSGNCAQWQVRTVVFDDSYDGFEASVPAGWTPISNHTNFYDGLWVARCAQ